MVNFSKLQKEFIEEKGLELEYAKFVKERYEQEEKKKDD